MGNVFLMKMNEKKAFISINLVLKVMQFKRKQIILSSVYLYLRNSAKYQQVNSIN